VIAATDGRIVYAGPAADAPSALDAKQRTNCDGRWIMPGLIDCHTHLVYGGNRAQEFEQRLAGASYEEIARAGGGIVSTVKATRHASAEQLVAAALPRLDALIAEGVTSIEIKSGYGLELDTERRQLQAARRLGNERAVSVRTSFLGAHTVPPEMKGNSTGYIDAICERMLPEIAAEGLADAVDAFCEGIAFSPDETARVFAKARALGLPERNLRVASYALAGIIGGVAGFSGGQLLLAFFANGALLNFYGFVPVALGGLGNNRGAIIGGLALGLFQQAANFLVGGIFSSVAVFTLFIVVLLAAPQGLFGAATARRV